MNCPAQLACALLLSLTLFLASAILLANSPAKNSGAYGSACVKSPLALPASTHARSIASESLTTPAKCLPVATICAPVSVAMSMTSSHARPPRRAGCDAYATPSASTRRPSASVLLISLVRPLRCVTTSSGRNAPDPIAFSATQRRRWTSETVEPDQADSGSAHRAPNAASAAAAPPRSDFIPGMPVRGLICKPPVSNVMPLPTTATFFFIRFSSPPAAAGTASLRCTSAGSRPSRAAHRPTAHIPPNPSASSAANRFTSATTSAPFLSRADAATRNASATNASGSISAGGASTMRAARRTPEPTSDAMTAHEDEGPLLEVIDDAFASDALSAELFSDASSATTTLAHATTPFLATRPRPSAVSLPSALLAVYVGNARATAAASGTACAGSSRAVTTPRVFPSFGCGTDRSCANAARALAGQLWRLRRDVEGSVATVTSRKGGEEGSSAEVVSSAEVSSEAAAGRRTVRLDPASPGEASRATDRIASRSASSAPRARARASERRARFVPRTRSSSAASASAIGEANATGASASQSSGEAGLAAVDGDDEAARTSEAPRFGDRRRDEARPGEASPLPVETRATRR